eukprot:COSAG06_NODE_53248_length_301_cov_0.757426_1_plen_72_part_00
MKNADTANDNHQAGTVASEGEEWLKELRNLSVADWQNEADKAGMELSKFKQLVKTEHAQQARERIEALRRE